MHQKKNLEVHFSYKQSFKNSQVHTAALRFYKTKKGDNSFKRISVSVQTVWLLDMCLYIHLSSIAAVAVHICMILEWFSLVLHRSHKIAMFPMHLVSASVPLVGCIEKFRKLTQKTNFEYKGWTQIQIHSLQFRLNHNCSSHHKSCLLILQSMLRLKHWQ